MDSTESVFMTSEAFFRWTVVLSLLCLFSVACTDGQRKPTNEKDARNEVDLSDDSTETESDSQHDTASETRPDVNDTAEAETSCPASQPPEISDIEVSPTEIPKADIASMTLEAQIHYRCFETPIQSATLFISSPRRNAPSEGFEIQSSRVVFPELSSDWLSGLQLGRYEIGATLQSEKARVTKRSSMKLDIK